MITWEFLVSKVPELKELERWVISLDANKLEYREINCYLEMKKRLVTLVGYAKYVPGYEKVPFVSEKKLVLFSEIDEHDKKYKNSERRRQIIEKLPSDEQILYTSEAYDVAWKYLYNLLPAEVGEELLN